MPIYQSMKDSGAEWVGEIPEHWNVASLPQLGREVRKRKGDTQESNLLSLSYGKIKRKDIRATEGLVPASFDGYNIIEAGDIVLRLTDLQNDHTSLRVGRATERGIITSAYVTVRPTDPNMSSYLYYVLHSYDMRKGFYGMGSGVRQGLTFAEARVLRLPVPPDDERDVIVAHLDSTCADIDTAIAEAKASIEEYKLLKQSVITQAVTKGLDQNVPMKDSGVEWIGRIPEHWNVLRGKTFMSPLSRPARSDDEIVTCFRDGEVTLRKNRREEGFTNALKEIGYQGIEPGDLVVHAMDGFAGAIGISDARGKGSPVLNVLDCNQNKRYMMYHLRAVAYREVFVALSTGIRIRSCDLRWSKLATLPYTIPPVHEQSAIVAYLDSACADIDAVAAEKQAMITDLESYKKSLIYEVVTGKRRVA